MKISEEYYCKTVTEAKQLRKMLRKDGFKAHYFKMVEPIDNDNYLVWVEIE